MCTNVVSNPSNQVVQNCHLVLRGKTPTQIRHCVGKILAPECGSHIWASHGIASQNKVIPN